MKFYFVYVLSFIFSVTNSHSQCSKQSVLTEPNLVVNGDFEQGNVGFTSPLNYVATTTDLPGNTYTLTTNGSLIHWGFSGTDHTTGSGKFMAVNGPANSSTIWSQTINTTPNTYYRLSAWFNNLVKTNVSPAALANVELRINGTKVSNSLTVTHLPDVWIQLDTLWHSGSNTSVVFSIYNNGTGLDGNDFAIDDIEFKECSCGGNNSKQSDQTICLGDSIQLIVSGGNSYAWDYSPSLSSLTIPNPYAKPASTTEYRVTINNDGCSFKDTIIVNVAANCCSDCKDSFPINKDLIGCYPLTNATDESGNGNHGTVFNGATSTTDRFNQSGNAYHFDGTNTSYISIPQSPSLNTSSFNNFTYMCWINVGNFTTSLPRRIFNIQDGSNRNYDLSYNYTSNKLNYINYNQNTYATDITSNETLVPGKWYHVAVIIDSLNNTRVFINGKLDMSSTNVVVKPVNPQYSIGRHLTQGWNFSGKIDDVRIYKRALSQQEIINLMPVGLNRNLGSLGAGTDQNLCIGDSVLLTAATDAFHYNWFPSATLSQPTSKSTYAKPVDTTLYKVTARSGVCSATDSVNVFVNKVNGSAGNDIALCYPQSIQLNATGGDSYEWNLHPSLNSFNIANPVATINKTDTFVVKITSNGCSIYDSVIVSLGSVFPLNVISDTTICFGDSVQLHASGATTYHWRSAINSYINDTALSTPWVKPFNTDTFILTATHNGCSIIDSVIVKVNNFVLDAGTDKVICMGDSVQLHAVSNGTFQWHSTSYISNNTIADPWVLPLGTDTFYLSSLYNGCTKHDTLVVVVNPKPVLNSGNDTALCKGDTIQLTAIGNHPFIWYPSLYIDDTSSALPKVYPPADQTYILKSPPGFCEASDTIHIKVNDLPGLAVSADTAICKGNSVTINALSGNAHTYFWHPSQFLNDAFIASPLASPDSSVKYVVTVKDTVSGCTNIDSVLVNVNAVKADFITDVNEGISPLTVNFTNLSEPDNIFYEWFFGDTIKSTLKNPSHIYTSEDLYRAFLVVNDSNECYDTSAIVLIDVKSRINLFIPNVFTPNEDGVNDVFEITYDTYSFVKLTGSIYNRWGGKVYDFEMPAGKWWDGTDQGNLAPEGVYFYIVNTIDKRGNAKTHHGTITLIR